MIAVITRHSRLQARKQAFSKRRSLDVEKKDVSTTLTRLAVSGRAKLARRTVPGCRTVPAMTMRLSPQAF
jgi:hypothetical protein